MINLFKKNNKKYKMIHKFKFMNPNKHWLFLVKTFIIMSVGLIIFSLYLLFIVSDDNSFQSANNQSKNPPVFVEEGLLEKVRDSIKEKNTERQDIESGIIYFVDPS
jgi:hypothetical protein